MGAKPKRQIVLNVDPEIADLFQGVSESERNKIELLFSVYLRKHKTELERLLTDFILERSKQSFFLNEDGSWKKEALDAVADEAEAKGLTPEILEEILNEE